MSHTNNVIWSGTSAPLRGKLAKFVFGFCCENSINNRKSNMTQLPVQLLLTSYNLSKINDKKWLAAHAFIW